jgi:hypothetical protein
MTTTYKNASYVMAGIACIITSCSIIAHYATNDLTYEEYCAAWYWISPFLSLATPILFCWIGILLRKKYPAPKTWVKALLLLLVPATYILWACLHGHGFYYGYGHRCTWLYSAILGFMIPTARLEGFGKEKGWLELVMFLASAFVYWGICRVVNHFSVASFQMLDTEWVRLFHRTMRFIPLAMAVFFLAEFSFSKTGQALGENRIVETIVKVLAVLYFIMAAWNCFRWRYYNIGLYYLWILLVQPVTVYLICWVIRKIKA